MPRHPIAKHSFAAALLVSLAVAPTVPAYADVILITQAKANAGNVSPGDSPGFPVTLSRPGSYQLADNLSVPSDKDGISITAHDVTIDLIQPTGSRTYATFLLAGAEVMAELQAHDVERLGERLQLHVDMNRAVLIDPETELVL